MGKDTGLIATRMTTPPKPAGYWDRQDLNQAIRANSEMARIVRKLSGHVVVSDLLGQLHAQHEALRNIEVRWIGHRARGNV